MGCFSEIDIDCQEGAVSSVVVERPVSIAEMNPNHNHEAHERLGLWVSTCIVCAADAATEGERIDRCDWCGAVCGEPCASSCSAPRVPGCNACEDEFRAGRAS